MHAIKRHGKIHPQIFFFSFFFCNKRKLKEKQRENKAGQNVVSFTCKYLFQRKEFTMKAYSKLFFKKGVNSAPKDNLVAVSDFFTILASPTALHF